MSKLSLVLVGGVGYVLGTRAGKDRYAEIKSRATGLWQDPKVQEKKSQATDLVKQKAPKVQEKVTDVAAKATGNGKRAVGHGTESEASVAASVSGTSDGDLDDPTPVADGTGRRADDTHV